MWKIDELEDGESIVAVAPILATGQEFTCRLVLSDRRIMTIRSPYFASILGLARFTHSRIEGSISLERGEVRRVSREASSGSVRIETRDNVLIYGSTGIGSRWLQQLAVRIPSEDGKGPRANRRRPDQQRP